MPIKLNPNELAFYPQPLVESEPNLLVITNQRIVQFGDAGPQEMPARQISHIGRVSERPLLPLGLLAVLVGLPLIAVGVWLFLSVRGMGGTLPGLPAIPGVPGLPGAPAAAPPAAAPPSEI